MINYYLELFKKPKVMWTMLDTFAMLGLALGILLLIALIMFLIAFIVGKIENRKKKKYKPNIW